jgi:signal-transduction protein with cAMP-binding, CBS, and nucleotidyltransferase domain
VLTIYQGTFAEHPLFARVVTKFKPFLVQLVSVLKLAHYAPGDVVIREGKLDSVMYVVAHGMLQVRLTAVDDLLC